MVTFWVTIALLTAAGVAFVVWPLLGGGRRATDAPASADEARRLAIYRDRRREIEVERDAGRLSAEEAQRSIDELVAEAAQQFGDGSAAREAPAGPAPAASSRAVAWALVAAVAIPATAAVVYSQVGSPGVVGVDPEMLSAAPGPEHMEKLIGELAARTQKNPQDAEAWAQLAVAQKIQGDLTAAMKSYEKAIELQPNNARLLAEFADTLATAHGGRFSGRALQLLERAVAADPTEPMTLWLLGTAQYQAGDLAGAVRYMQRLAAVLPPESDDGRQVRNILARFESELAASGGKAPAPQAAAGAAGAAAPKAPPAGGTAAAPGAAISGTVSIDDKLRAQIKPGAVLFISARPAEGPRMPLAAVRLSPDRWPVRFELSDAQAMDPSRPLSGVPQVVIEARISASGTAMRASGDAFGVSPPVKLGARDLAIRIDQQVP